MRVALAAIVVGASTMSKTTILVNAVLESARQSGASTTLVNISDITLPVADGRKAEEYEGETATLLSLIDASDAVVFGMPVYRAGIPGSLKNLLDIVPRGRFDGLAQALRAKPVVVVATGATDHHFLAVDTLAEVMRGFFAAYVVPPGIYASHADFTDGVVTNLRVMECAQRSGHALVDLAAAIVESDHLRAVEPLV